VSTDRGSILDRPVKRFNTNQPSTIALAAKVVSPNIRIHRSLSINPVCRNSADRAYHVPYSTEAHVCIKPIGSKLISTMSTLSTSRHLSRVTTKRDNGHSTEVDRVGILAMNDLFRAGDSTRC
jgi:hypothetical protein